MIKAHTRSRSTLARRPARSIATPRPRTARHPHLVTIGYQGLTADALVRALKAAGVTRLLDVRELPLSRRKGFSKRALAARLASSGIDYQHVRALGTPRGIRHRLRAHGDWRGFFSEYREYLATQRAVLDGLAGTLTGTTALLCYERSPTECHRSVVAEALARRLRTFPVHLGLPRTPAASRPRPARRIRPCVSVKRQGDDE